MRIADCGLRNSEDRVESSGFGVRSSGLRKFFRPLLVPFIMGLLIFISLHSIVFATEKWTGVDEAVVKKIAKEQGREAREPLINTDQGDLLLFVFLLAGAVGGFVGGYYWRILMVEKASKIKKKD